MHSIMAEVRRGLYMDERTGEKLPGFERMAKKVRDSVRELADLG